MGDEVNLARARVEVIVSEPWEFQTRYPGGKLSGIVRSTYEKEGRTALLIELDQVLDWNDMQFPQLLLVNRTHGQNILDLSQSQFSFIVCLRESDDVIEAMSAPSSYRHDSNAALLGSVIRSNDNWNIQAEK